MFKKLLLVMVVVLGALPASATTAYYVGSAGEANFIAAAGNLIYTSSFSIDGTGFIGTESGTGLQFLAFTGNNSGPAPLTISGGKLTQTVGTDQATTLVDVNVTAYAIGLYVRSTGSTTAFCIEPPGASACSQNDPTQAAYVTSSSNVFFGIISDSPITDFQLRRDGLGSKLSIVSVATLTTPLGGGGDIGGAAAPEPSSLALMGGALIAIPLLARRRRK